MVTLRFFGAGVVGAVAVAGVTALDAAQEAAAVRPVGGPVTSMAPQIL